MHDREPFAIARSAGHLHYRPSCPLHSCGSSVAGCARFWRRAPTPPQCAWLSLTIHGSIDPAVRLASSVILDGAGYQIQRSYAKRSYDVSFRSLDAQIDSVSFLHEPAAGERCAIYSGAGMLITRLHRLRLYLSLPELVQPRHRPPNGTKCIQTTAGGRSSPVDHRRGAVLHRLLHWADGCTS